MTHGKLSMPIDLKAALGFFSDAIDKIMLVAGFFLLILAVFLSSPMYPWFSAASFLFGVILIVVGTILHYESFALKVPSREGWGTILICVSAVFMAAAVVVSLFAVPGSVWISRAGFKPGQRSVILITLTRPNAWLAPILGWTGIGLLVFGAMLKFFRDIF